MLFFGGYDVVLLIFGGKLPHRTERNLDDRGYFF